MPTSARVGAPTGPRRPQSCHGSGVGLLTSGRGAAVAHQATPPCIRWPIASRARCPRPSPRRRTTGRRGPVVVGPVVGCPPRVVGPVVSVVPVLAYRTSSRRGGRQPHRCSPGGDDLDGQAAPVWPRPPSHPRSSAARPPAGLHGLEQGCPARLVRCGVSSSANACPWSHRQRLVGGPGDHAAARILDRPTREGPRRTASRPSGTWMATEVVGRAVTPVLDGQRHGGGLASGDGRRGRPDVGEGGRGGEHQGGGDGGGAGHEWRCQGRMAMGRLRSRRAGRPACGRSGLDSDSSTGSGVPGAPAPR